MKIRSLAAAAAVLTLCTVPLTAAAGADPGNGTKGAFTLAVFGDEPYGTVQGDHAQFDATPAFIDSINADPDVSTVVHLGDIHSGKQWCTRPYDQSIYDLWTRFTDPLVYTPGDNEWTDCHKAARGRRQVRPCHRPDQLRDRPGHRATGRLRRAEPDRQPGPGPVDVLRPARPDARQRQPGGAVPGTGR